MSVPCNGLPEYYEQQSLACLELRSKSGRVVSQAQGLTLLSCNRAVFGDPDTDFKVESRTPRRF
jgi:hypothetical protein